MIESGYALAPLLFSVVGLVVGAVIFVLILPRKRPGSPFLDVIPIVIVAMAVTGMFMLTSTFGHPERWARMFLNADGATRSQLGILLALGIAVVRLRSAPVFAGLEVMIGLSGLAFGDSLASADDGPAVQMVTFGASILLLATGLVGIWPTIRMLRESLARHSESNN